MSKILSDISRSRKQIHEQMDAATKFVGRKASDVCLVAVSKRQSQERILAALQDGQRVFGENQIIEAERHWQDQRTDWPGLQLHLIGHLQSNKARRAVQLFDVIETLDSIKLGKALAKEMQTCGRALKVLVQVNTGEEPQKHGILPIALPEFLKELNQQAGLVPAGLMCIPPQNEEAGLHFGLLAKLAQENQLAELSMGMSNDFEKAIHFGASSIRVGSAFFGIRDADSAGFGSTSQNVS